VETITKRWKYYQQHPNVIGYVARTDRYRDTKIIDRPSEILLYALNAVNRDPGISDEQIYTEFIAEKYGEASVPYVFPAFKNAFEISTSSLYTLGLCMANHSTLSCDYRSIYTRYVSGRWMDEPVIHIEHDVNRDFHYYKDVVNHLAPAHLKLEESRLFEEDSWLKEKDWIRQGEMITGEYLDYIIREKDYGVNLAEVSLDHIVEGKSKIRAAAYQDLYDTFYRTLIKAKLSRAAAKAYFAYRLWFSDEAGRNQEILDIFWSGIDEMNEMAGIARQSFGDSPGGGWSWEEDLETVTEYTERMTVSGWDDYGGIPVTAR
jgi:hypothetical protein